MEEIFHLVFLDFTHGRELGKCLLSQGVNGFNQHPHIAPSLVKKLGDLFYGKTISPGYRR